MRRPAVRVGFLADCPASREGRGREAFAEQFGARERFTGGRSVAEWLSHLYQDPRDRAGVVGIELPSFEAFWEAGAIELPPPDEAPVLLRVFRFDPDGERLPTPSGKIEIFSESRRVRL